MPFLTSRYRCAIGSQLSTKFLKTESEARLLYAAPQEVEEQKQIFYIKMDGKEHKEAAGGSCNNHVSEILRKELVKGYNFCARTAE